MRIWVSDLNDYDGGIDGYYISLDVAIRNIKARFGSPYQVTWREEPMAHPCEQDLEEQDHHRRETRSLVGHFEAVQHYSVQHTAQWDIYPVEVKGA